jgi:uncharacterized protein YjbI with pentapeptide repeats
MSTEDENLARELARELASFLREVSAEKREAREHASEDRTRGIFRKWLGENGTSISAIVAALSIVIGGLWSVTKYVDQQQKQTEQRAREAEVERHRVLGEFAIDLTKPETRNGAAYAVAALSGKDASPLLTEYLIESANDKDAATFRAALAQAFILIGESSLPPLVRLSRESVSSGQFKTSGLASAIEPVILHFLRARSSYFFRGGEPLRNVMFSDADLSYQNLDHAALQGSKFMHANFCSSSLRGADLAETKFYEGAQFGQANLQGASLAGADFGSLPGSGTVDFSGAHLERAHGSKVNLTGADLSAAFLSHADLPDIDLEEADLSGARLDAADLSRGHLSETHLYKADLTNSSLRGADLTAADLEDADLVGADLSHVQWFTWREKPFVLLSASDRQGAGANVLGANLQGAKIDQISRKYLCQYGARNVPGGCQDVSSVRVPKRTGLEFGGSSCF